MSGKIVTIAQQKGGSGKTTVAAHLAVAWARRRGRTVAILDIDPQGSLGEWLEARERRLGEDATGLGFRTASGWGSRREASALARDYDYVIIDTPPKAEQDARVAMDVCDLIVVPVQPTPVDLWATKATLKVAAGEDTPAILVINRVPSRARLTGEMMEALREFGSATASARLGNRVSYAASIGRGSTVIEDAPGSRAAEEIDALAEELLTCLRR
jgi:chromosome partitioning protein